jgi:hypothetical protein
MKFDYVFPKKIADFMAGISQRTQYEATLLSLTFILFGIIFFAGYVLFTESGWLFKLFWVINAICGLVFLGSLLITTYQQYRTFKEVMGLYDIKDETKKVIIDEALASLSNIGERRLKKDGEKEEI